MEITLNRRHGVPFYHCSHPTWAGVAHGFSTRVGGVSPAPFNSLNLGANRGDKPDNVELNFRRFCAAVGSNPQAIVKNQQIHSTLVRSVTMDDVMSSPGQPGVVEADGLVTDVPGLCLTIFSADCIPLLLYDPKRRCIAAAHAGWRGTAAGIAAQAVKAMVEGYGCSPEHILAAIGPGISSCCFETHADVPHGLYQGLGSLAQPLIRPLAQKGKFRVDLKGTNALWLERCGISPQHIVISRACTACQPLLFWSHRKLGNGRGSMAAMIQLR